MHVRLRRLRGMLGMSAVWALGFGVFFALLSTVVGVIDPDSIDAGEDPLSLGLFGARLGALGGVIFSILLSTAHQRTILRDLSVRGAAMWGALGAAALPLLAGANASNALLLAPVGAGLAAAAIAIAKRGELEAPFERPRLPP
jgi:hypothetical protein